MNNKLDKLDRAMRYSLGNQSKPQIEISTIEPMLLHDETGEVIGKYEAQSAMYLDKKYISVMYRYVE